MWVVVSEPLEILENAKPNKISLNYREHKEENLLPSCLYYILGGVQEQAVSEQHLDFILGKVIGSFQKRATKRTQILLGYADRC